MDAVDRVKVEVPVPPDARLTLVGFNEADGPLGETAATRFTVSANPARLVSLIVDVAEDPGVKARPLGFAEMKKSGCDG